MEEALTLVGVSGQTIGWIRGQTVLQSKMKAEQMMTRLIKPCMYLKILSGLSYSVSTSLVSTTSLNLTKNILSKN